MAERSVVGVYESLAQAEEAVHTLDRAGFPVKHVSIVTQNLARDQTMPGSITPGADLIPGAAATGAWMGGLVSLLVGVTCLWVPGFGPLLVVGRLASLRFLGAEGALAGVAAGSFLGALANWDIAEEHMRDYAQQVQGGKHLVIAYGTADGVERAHAIPSCRGHQQEPCASTLTRGGRPPWMRKASQVLTRSTVQQRRRKATAMNNATNILMAVDDSAASYRAVTYVGSIMGGREDFRVCLLHASPPLPRALLACGGASDPPQEAQEEARLHGEQAHWLEAVRQAAEPAFICRRCALLGRGETPRLRQM